MTLKVPDVALPVHTRLNGQADTRALYASHGAPCIESADGRDASSAGCGSNALLAVQVVQHRATQRGKLVDPQRPIEAATQRQMSSSRVNFVRK